MRVLWFVPCSVAAVRQRLGLSQGETGWWIESLLEAVTKGRGLELGVVWGGAGISQEVVFEENGVAYYALPYQPPQLRILGKARQMPFSGSAWDTTVAALLARCEGVLAAFNPDLIHVHGTERPYGLLAERTRIPVVVSIQGVLKECLKTYFGRLRLTEQLRIPSLLAGYLEMRRRAALEARIYGVCKYFLGRTLWDQGHQAALNPSASYFHAEELVRPELFAYRWRMATAKRHSIYATSSCSPLKGLETLLEAVALLRSGFPDLRLRVAGNYPKTGFGRYVRQRVRQLRLENCVEFLGWLGPDRLGQELEGAHVFALPSFVENSPLSLAEAQVVGVPVVASWAGGIPSRVKDGFSGLLFPPGDAALLSLQIQRLFDDDCLALRLADRAQKEAKARHHAPSVVADLLRTYHTVVGGHGGRRRIEEVKKQGLES